MGRSVFRSAVLVSLFFTSTALAGPLLSTGTYTVDLPNGGTYEVSSEVSHGSGGYTYSYSVKNLTGRQRYFEFGVAESLDVLGLHTETNPQVVAGPGVLLRDKTPFFSYVATPHNYVFTDLLAHHRIGILVLPGQTQVLSFQDEHLPTLVDWTLRERNPTLARRHNTQLGLGQVYAPGAVAPAAAPEPTSLTLALLGVGGLAVNAFRRRRTRA